MAKNNFFPLILLSSERSGTNLLRAILSCHSEISAPPPAGLIACLAPNRYRYFAGKNDEGLNEMVNDAIQLTKVHFAKGWGVPLVREQILSRLDEPSFWSVFRAINEIFAQGNNAKYWFTKEPRLSDWGYELLANLPGAKFVYFVRDGRDVAASRLRSYVHECHIYSAATNWRDEQEKCLRLLSDPLFSEVAITVKYESLLSDPVQTLSRLLSFLDLEFEEQMLDFYNDSDVRKYSRKSHCWGNITKPIMRNNTKKYRDELSVREIRIFESVAGDQLKLLGYNLDYEVSKKINFLKRIFYIFVAGLREKRRSLFPSDAYKALTDFRQLSDRISRKSLINPF